MAQKVRLAIQKPRPGFIARCTSCRKEIDPQAEFYRDVSCDDELCAECAQWFIDGKYAIVVTEQ